MSGRRRYTRFLLSAPHDGSLLVREELAIESWREGELEAVSTMLCPLGEALTLELPGDDTSQISVVVRESRPFVTADGSIRYRLRMTLEKSDASTVIEKGKRES